MFSRMVPTWVATVALVLMGLVAAPAHAEGTPPLAINDEFNTQVGATVQMPVRYNDYEPSGLPMSILDWTPPDSPAVTVTRSGDDLVATVGQGAPAFVTFTYRVTNGSLASNSASVTIRVNGPGSTPPPPPVVGLPVANDDVMTLRYPGEFTVNPLANDSDPHGGQLVLAGFIPPEGQDYDVIVTQVGNSLSFVVYNVAGGRTISVDYIVQNSAGTSTATVTIPTKQIFNPLVKKIKKKPGLLTVTNPNLVPMRFKWFEQRAWKVMGDITVPAGGTVKIKVRWNMIEYFSWLKTDGAQLLVNNDYVIKIKMKKKHRR